MAEPNGSGNGNYSLSFSGVIKAIKDVGFPIAITLYLLLSLSPKIDKVIDQQAQIINVLLQQSVRK